MPWKEIDSRTASSLNQQPGTYFILFYASGNPPWCSDCREAAPALEAVFGADNAPILNVVRVGERDEWKSAENPWKSSAYHVNEIPQLIKMIDVCRFETLPKGNKLIIPKGKEVDRLGEEACKYEKRLKHLL